MQTNSTAQRHPTHASSKGFWLSRDLVIAGNDNRVAE